MSNFLARAWRWCRQWYTTAEKRPDVGRNDPCWCGSRNKYKHCHMAEDARRGALPPNTAPNVQKAMQQRATKRLEKMRGRR